MNKDQIIKTLQHNIVQINSGIYTLDMDMVSQTPSDMKGVDPSDLNNTISETTFMAIDVVTSTWKKFVIDEVEVFKVL